MEPNKPRVDTLNREMEEFIEANQAEVIHRYNSLLAEINKAKGVGILSIHNRHFGSKGLYFGAAVQHLYRQNNGQPLPETTPVEATPQSTTPHTTTVEEVSHPTQQAAVKASQAEGDDDNDASEFIARNAS